LPLHRPVQSLQSFEQENKTFLRSSHKFCLFAVVDDVVAAARGALIFVLFATHCNCNECAEGCAFLFPLLCVCILSDGCSNHV
jgi:hypothetical protein